MKQLTSAALTVTMLASPAFAVTTGVEYAGSEYSYATVSSSNSKKDTTAMEVDADMSYFFRAPFGVQVGLQRLKFNRTDDGDAQNAGSTWIGNAMLLYQFNDSLRFGIGATRSRTFRPGQTDSTVDETFIDLAARYTYGPWQVELLYAEPTEDRRGNEYTHSSISYSFDRDSYVTGDFTSDKFRDVYRLTFATDITDRIDVEGEVLITRPEDDEGESFGATLVGYYSLNRDWRVGALVSTLQIADEKRVNPSPYSTDAITTVGLGAKYYYTDQISFYGSIGHSSLGDARAENSRYIRFGVDFDLGDKRTLLPTTKEMLQTGLDQRQYIFGRGF